MQVEKITRIHGKIISKSSYIQSITKEEMNKIKQLSLATSTDKVNQGNSEWKDEILYFDGNGLYDISKPI